MEAGAGLRNCQLARRGDYSGLFRVLPMGVFAIGAGGGTGGAGLFGERVRGGDGSYPREFPQAAQDAGGADYRSVDYAEYFAHDHHARFDARSEEHTSELQSLMRISYAVFCLKKKKHR